MENIKKRNQACDDSFAFLTTSNIGDLINISRTYPCATDESNMELLKAYREGDQDALALLIKTNIRLLIHIAKKYAQYTTSYELIDLVEEGALALIEAANEYNLDADYKFSTFYGRKAKFQMLKAMGKHDKLIRRPAHITESITSYNKLKQQFENAGKTLDDETAMQELGITKKRLETIKNDHKFQAASLDAKLDDDDEDSTELSNFVKSGENISDDIVSKIFEKELLIFLKQTLTDFQFYVLMMRVFAKKTLKTIAEEFQTTHTTIQNTEKKAFDIIKTKCIGTTEIDYRIPNDVDIDQLRGAPIHPHDITKYMFYREFLVEKERELLKLYIKGNYEPEDKLFASLLKVDLEEYLRIKNSLFRKLNNTTEQMEIAYKSFREKILKTYGSRIYSIDWDMDLADLKDNIKYISTLWEGKTYDEVIELLNKNKITITPQIDSLLQKYFSTNDYPITDADLRKAERDINSVIFGMRKKVDIPLDRLLETAKKNKESFKEEQYDYLMMKVFNLMSRKDFKKKYPNTQLLNGLGFYVVQKLENLHFNVANYKELNFTKSKYLQIRQQCVNTLPQKQIQILDMYFGYKCKKSTVYGIQNKLNIKYEKARDLLSKAKSAAQSIYLSKSGKKVLETDYYIPYILDENCDLNDLHRILLKGHLIDKMSYDELSKQTGLSKHDVSANILDGIMKIDFYRFNILKKYKYPKNIILKAIGSSKYTIEQRKILLDLFKGMSRSEVVEKHNITMKQLETLMIKQSDLCHKLITEGKMPTYEEMSNELNIHKAASLLNQNERIILSFTYGIKCDFNPRGIKFAREYFQKIYPKLSSKYNKLLKSAQDTIVGKRLGIDRATMDIVNRDDLIRSLRDPRIPITDKERELLYYTYEINNYPYKDLNELAELYKERSTSIKRRIQRAIVTINKYENGELQALVSYEYDVENNLKYFTKNDREILISKYRDNLNYEEIAKKYNLTIAQVEKLSKRLDAYLRDILDEEINPFDFDYYYEVVDSDDFPFYDDKELAKKMFDLYYEKRMSASEIKEELNLSISISTIQRTINSLVIATVKRKESIKKANIYTYENVLEYYKNNKYNMDKEQRYVYHNYFKKVDKALSQDKEAVKAIPIGPLITIDLIKDGNEDAFSFDNTPREEALKLLNKYKKELTDDTIRTITTKYNIKGREYLSNKSQRKILKLLSAIDLDNIYGIDPEEIPLMSLTDYDEPIKR